MTRTFPGPAGAGFDAARKRGPPLLMVPDISEGIAGFDPATPVNVLSNGRVAGIPRRAARQASRPAAVNPGTPARAIPSRGGYGPPDPPHFFRSRSLARRYGTVLR